MFCASNTRLVNTKKSSFREKPGFVILLPSRNQVFKKKLDFEGGSRVILRYSLSCWLVKIRSGNSFECLASAFNVKKPSFREKPGFVVLLPSRNQVFKKKLDFEGCSRVILRYSLSCRLVKIRSGNSFECLASAFNVKKPSFREKPGFVILLPSRNQVFKKKLDFHLIREKPGFVIESVDIIPSQSALYAHSAFYRRFPPFFLHPHRFRGEGFQVGELPHASRSP